MQPDYAKLADRIETFNRWRRGGEGTIMPDPRELGVLLDDVAAALRMAHAWGDEAAYERSERRLWRSMAAAEANDKRRKSGAPDAA